MEQFDIVYGFNDPEDGKYYHTILYDPWLKRYYYYNNGVYNERPKKWIEGIYLQIMNQMDMITTSQQKNHCLTYIETGCMYEGEWLDNHPRYDCVANGIVDLETRALLPHHPRFHFKHQIQRNYNPEVSRIIPPRFDQCLKAIPDKYDRDNYLKFWLAAAHKKHEYECFLMCFGVKGGGKSSNLNIFAKMWGSQVTGKKALHFLGKKFGLSNIYDKRINIHPDMPIVDLDPYCISILKNLTGNDDEIEIEIKGLTPIKYKITLFLAFAIQQLPGFNIHAEKEIDSIMRRVVLVEFPNMQEVNREFKKSLLDPVFLDQLYSWLVVTNPVPFYEDYKEEEAWIQHNKNKWLMNADPILRILLDNYEYKEKHTVKAYDVVAMVREQLTNEGMLVPKSVKTQITNAFSTMNISNNGKRGSNCLYENCRQVDPEDIDMEELMKEVELNS